MLLIHPPVAKPCEPPAGIARLSGALKRCGIRQTTLDANLEGLGNLLRSPQTSFDTWTNRAFRHLPDHLNSLRHRQGYQHFDHYKRAVKDLNRILEKGALPASVRLGLANYEDENLSPTRSSDLIRCAENPEDNPFYPYLKKRLLGLIESEQPSAIGFSLNYLNQALCTFAMIGILREECPGLPLILGGGLVTSWVRRPGWKNPFGGLVDHLVAGPGEGPLLSILGVDGRCAEEHTTPNYDSLPVMEYFAPGLILPYSASIGCYWNRCSFCPERTEGNPYLPTRIEKVVHDLSDLAMKTKPVLIHILDNAIRPALMKVIANNPPGPPWYGFARITQHLTDLEFCMALKRSGCVMLKLGLESGDQRVLDQMQKGIDLEQASLALKTLKKAGIATYVYLLFGTPWETMLEARRTLEFTIRHHEMINFLNLAIFNMPIHGPEVVDVETHESYEGDLSLYTGFEHPKGWNRKLIRQFLDKEFKRHPAVASILRRDPPTFTSNHAPFFMMKEKDGVNRN
ncbi:MAG: radical SAM protein [Thermodesulfobacteriota bacterium]|jgi:hypothetical protein